MSKRTRLGVQAPRPHGLGAFCMSGYSNHSKENNEEKHMTDPPMEYRTGSIRYVIGTAKRNMPRTEKYVRREFGSPFVDRELNNAILAFAMYDEDETLHRSTVVGGEPPEEMRRIMAFEFGPQQEVIADTA